MRAAFDLANRTGRFCVIGRAGMDLYPAPAGSRSTQAKSFDCDLGGSAANIAVALCKQGWQAALLSKLSCDPVGDFVYHKLVSHGVDCDLIARTKTAGGVTANGVTESGVTESGVTESGIGAARTQIAVAEALPCDGRAVLYRHQASDLLIDCEQLEGIDFQTIKALIITGTALSSPSSASTCLEASRRAQAVECPTVLDLDYRVDAWPDEQAARTAYQTLIPMVDLLVGNDMEFDVLADSKTLESPDSGLMQAMDYGADGRLVIYKMGAQGCFLINGSVCTKFGIFPVQPVKPFGAGDAFLGNLLAVLGAKHDLHQAILAGSAAAAMVVAQTGCASAMPNQAQLADFCRTRTMIPAS
ncbi:MAG: PfkB family carbohydrate kinase [Pseudomonadota bacterium]